VRICVSSCSLTIFFIITQQPSVVKDLLITEDSRSHPNTPHLVGLLWTSDQLVAETSTWQHTTLTTGRHACLRRNSKPNPSNRAAADPRLRPHGHWDRHQIFLGLENVGRVDFREWSTREEDQKDKQKVFEQPWIWRSNVGDKVIVVYSLSTVCAFYCNPSTVALSHIKPTFAATAGCSCRV